MINESLTSGSADQEVIRLLKSRAAAKRLAIWSAVPSLGGLAVLAVYRLTANDDLASGLASTWSLIGGVMTLVVALIALIQIVRSFWRRPRDGRVIGFHFVAMLGVVIAIVTAVFCGYVCEHWFLSAHQMLTVINSTETPIDRLVIHFGSGDINAGALAARETKEIGVVWVWHPEKPLEITTTFHGHSRRKIDMLDPDLCCEKQPFKRHPLTIAVEDSELPK